MNGILKNLSTEKNICEFTNDDRTVAGSSHRFRVKMLSRLDVTPSETAISKIPRNVENSTNFRGALEHRANAPERRNYSRSGETAMFGQKPVVRHRRTEESVTYGKEKMEASSTDVESPLQRYENAVLRYQKAKHRPVHPEDQARTRQQSSSHSYSSSDESAMRNKSKSTSSIDTQSVNNILDEYEDLDYRRSSDLSETGSINVTNFEAIMLDQQKRKEQQQQQQQQQQQEKLRTLSVKPPMRCSPLREKLQPVLKVNQQTQVRQCARQKESVKRHLSPLSSEGSTRLVPPESVDADNRSIKVPEILLRKGEVQKRVDEWLSQTQNQNFLSSRGKGLTRSNSSAEQKYQRRYRQDSARSRSTDETREKLNGTSSSYDDLSRGKVERRVDKISVGVNTSRTGYKEYLAVKGRGGHEDYGYSVSVSRSRDPSPGTASRIPQRGPSSSSFRSRRVEANGEDARSTGAERSTSTSTSAGKNTRTRWTLENRAIKGKNDNERSGVACNSVASSVSGIPTTMTSNTFAVTAVLGRRSSFKRSQCHEQTGQKGATSLVKEETGHGVSKGPTTNLGDHGASPSPNKDGESGRSSLLTDVPQRFADKAVDAACKFIEATSFVDSTFNDNATSPAKTGITVQQQQQGFDGRKEGKMERQGKRETIYASVGARIRALQTPAEGKLVGSNVGQSGNVAAELRKPMKLSRKEEDREGSKDEKSKGSPIDARSTFKAGNRVYSSLQRLNEQNCAKTKILANGETSSVSRYGRSNHVEKIYERSLQPQVIRVDDLESILRPSLRISAYGERTTGGIDGEASVFPGEETTEEEESDSRYEQLETIEEDDRRSEISARGYQKVIQCRDIRRSPRLSGGKEGRAEREEFATNNRWEESIVLDESARTFATLEPGNHWREETNARHRSRSTSSAELGGLADETHDEETRHPRESTFILEDFKGGSCENAAATRVKRTQINHSRENSNLSTSTIPLDELEAEARKGSEDDGKYEKCHSNFRSDVSAPETRSSPAGGCEREKSEERGSIVREVLVKNLQFMQDLPKDARNESRTASPIVIEQNVSQGSFNFHNVLRDDYANVRDASVKENKVYVTKEEMERQRLLDLLKKGDYDTVKSELERSYTVSTPGGSSPVCCPPCSPPPAPAAYISSARASSRRLGSAGGPPSPEKDPLGRLLRFLKTFYRELGTREPPHLPSWASPLPLGSLCPAYFQPHLQLMHKSEQEHRLENIKPDQIFGPVRLSDGTVSEAPRRVAIEGGPGSGRTTLCLRLLHHWATQGDGPALAFIVPLRELRGGPLLNYLARELFPRTAILGDAVSQVWRTLHLMEDRVLFVLDGYDECTGGRASLGDAADLLEGRLFPDARILVTCSPSNAVALSPLVQRRIHLAGLDWSHVERLCVAYFIHNDIAEKGCEFLETLNVQPVPVKQLGQHPLGWIMLCCLYQDSGSLPQETSALVQAAVKCIVKRSLDPPIPYNEEIPGHCRKRLEDFGKLSLAALREGRCCYTEAELRARGGGMEITRLGFLTKGLTFGQKRKPDLFTPIHIAVAEFLAAYYLTSVAQYANILRRELEGLPPGIINHLAGLLGPKTHLILNQLCPLEVPPRAVFSLLKAAGASDGNISAVCRLVGGGTGFGPAPNERPPAPLVHTSPLELEGWARILESPTCTLEALEVVFQIERGSDSRYLDDFFRALANNDSVKLVRITSLLGQEFPADEAQRLAGHLKSVLTKKRLNDFELVITCLEESAHDGLECVVNALCRGLSYASNSLARLVLDMNLSGEQVSRVCEALRRCVQVQALHLPHLGCGCEGLASVAELLKERPLLALNLAGSWGAKNEDPSSSGISMGSGSGSGSSGCASSTLGTLPLNRCYSSLPRGALAAYGSLTRPATLPRLPLGLGLGPPPGNENGNGQLPPNEKDRECNTSSKRNSDSVLCHRLPLLHPLPTCDVTSHQGTGFHEIFSAIRKPNCKLRSLNVSKCLLGGLDAGCLGETIRRARNLDALRAAGASRPADVMPLVLALTEAPCLQLLDLASPRLALDDHPSRLLCHALARNGTLKLLSLEGWTFRIEEADSLSVFSELLRYTSVRELSLCNARLHLAVHEGPLSRLGNRDDAGAELLRAAAPPSCPAIVFLRLAGFQVTINDRLALRGPLLLPFLAGFTALSELDLSLDKSTIGGSSGSLLFIDDKMLLQFFSCFSTHFRNLQSLRINFWRVTLEDSEKTMRQTAKHLKLCNLSFLKANGLIVTDSAKKVQMEHIFVQTILTHLQYLTWLCLDGVDLTESQASSIGKCVRDRYPGTTLEISAKDVHVKSVKALVAATEEGGRADVVYTGGSYCRLKITKIQKNGKSRKK